MIRLALLALLALGCADAGDEVSIDADVSGASSASAVAEWLPVDHPAAAAQARWGMPIPCAGLQVVQLPRSELQLACNSAAELAARAPGITTNACTQPHACEIDLADDLPEARRQVVLTHELGHVLDPHGVNHHVSDGCPPDGKPGAALMCAGGPASGEPDPTPADFDLVLP